MTTKEQPVSFRSFAWRSCLAALMLVTTGPGVGAAGLLRTGGGTASSSSSASANSAVTAAQAAALAQRSQATLLRSNTVQQSIQAMQAAARAAAQSASSSVPNGLGVGGLQVATGVPANLNNVQPSENAALWQGAQLPTQTTGTDGKTDVNIKQTAQQAFLTWQTFNVGQKTTLTYDQSAGGSNQSQWIVFNKINDPSGSPSQILGTIKATGQVYVINQNGIIFGGSSQVNTHTLVASALPINDSLVSRGLLNNPDTQFLFTALPQSAGGNGPTDAFIPPAPLTIDGHVGDVVVEAGAQLSSPTNSEKNGGRIALIGANVTNAGSISTPDGQAILAAGLQVGFAAHDSSDPSLRGLDVFVGNVGTYAGTVTNTGTIDAPRANVTLTGKTIAQNGAVTSTTSASVNGRIDVLANYNAIGSGGYDGRPAFFAQSTGNVSFGGNSVTTILPELNSNERAVGTALALSSQINVSALTIYMAPQALIYAPGANLTMRAGVWNLTGSGSTAQDQFVSTDGQIYFDSNASIDVGGSTDVAASVTDNIISVQLRGAELANSPLQRDGALRGQTIQIDIRQTGTLNGTTWVGTPLADTSGYVALVDHTVGQLITNGGTVNLSAGGSVVMQSGASINVSGGTTNFAGGNIATTKVLSSGHVYDISQATPDKVYSGIYTGAAPTYEAGYVQGGNAGSINITAPTVALDGSFQGNVVTGPRQRGQAPTAGAFHLVLQGQYGNPVNPLLPFIDSRSAPALSFESGSTLAPAEAFALDAFGHPSILRADRIAEVVLSPDLFAGGGFGDVLVNNREGDITLAAGNPLTLAPKGALTLLGANIDIRSDITAPGGALVFTAYNISQGTINDLAVNPASSAPEPVANRGRVTVASGVTLSTAGLVVGEQFTGDANGVRPYVTAGGSIALTGRNVDLASGSVLDVSGGVFANSTGKFTYGTGGKLSILAGKDPSISAVTGGTLTMGAGLRGYSGGKGASLIIQAPLLQIGDTDAASNVTRLTNGFFNEGGFASFDLRALGVVGDTPGVFAPAVLITADADIAPQVMSWQAVADASASNGIRLDAVLRPEGLRTAASLTFTAIGVRDSFRANPLLVRGDLLMENGARITTDAGGAVTFAGDTATVNGLISAHGGAISVKGAGDSNLLFVNAGADHAITTVSLGAASVLDASGTVVLTPDTTGHAYRTGLVLSGGSVNISGNIHAEAGALIDVSGASGILDLLPVYSGVTTTAISSARLATRVDSNGGAIALSGGQELISAATLRGFAGGDYAQGGSLKVSSGYYRTLTDGIVPTPLDANLIVTQSGAATTAGRGNFSADSFNDGGFDSLVLAGTVRFEGDVSLTARRSIRLADAGVIFADGAISLSASSVSVGTGLVAPSLPGEVLSAFQVAGAPYYFNPAYGTGSLTVSATHLIDVGNLSLQGIGGVILDVSSGDLRGSGTFGMAGDLLIAAGQIYPVTAGSFTISVSDYQDGGAVGGTITTYKGDDRSLPFSAGGTLNLYASTINQGGTLRAPIGSINLGWNGTGPAPVDAITGQAVATARQITLTSDSITSVSALDPLTGKGVALPYGISSDGTNWIDPTGKDITTTGVPAKKITISGQSVTTETGANVDINGGGDLYAYRFVKGVGGTKDILASSGSFAVMPGYQADYAAVSAYNNSTAAVANLGSDAGYTNSTLAAGDQIYLDGSAGLTAGVYTLLPARYALLPGAFLVTPKSGAPTSAAVVQPDGASTVAGYRFNDSLDLSSGLGPVRSSFEVASQAVVRTRAQYDDFSANSFLSKSATNNNVAVPRLPVDAGQLVFSATQAMKLEGGIDTRAFTGGLGGLIDINSPVDIVIGGPNSIVSSGQLLLDASQLSTYEGASILIGGTRSIGQNGTSVAVTSNNLTVDNAGSPLSGAGIILVAKQNLTLADGADIRQTGSLGGSTGTLFFGSAGTVGSGDGALLRISSDSAAAISRAGISTNSTATLSLGSGVNISGGSALILDSTGTTHLDPTAVFGGQAVTLNSGRISLQLSDPGALQSSPGLVLTGASLGVIQASARSLSLLSYSSIDIYGSGQIGTADFSSLSLRAPSIRGFNAAGGQINFVAQNILLDGGVGGTAPVAAGLSDGTLAFNATKVLTLGAGQLAVGQYSNLLLSGAKGILVAGSGGLTASGNLELSTPLLTGATAASQQITAGGTLALSTPETGGTATVSGGLGATLTLTGTGIAVDSKISLPSGTLTLRATGGDVAIGATTTGSIDVGGTAKIFNDQTRFTKGGTVNLIADTGGVSIALGSTLSVAAQSGGGDAGLLSVSTPNGFFTLAGSLLGQAGTSGQGGAFSLDAHSLMGGSLAVLDASLNTAGFTQERDFRFRTGDVLVDGTATTRNFTLSADQGSISVTGKIDASGATGGSIKLSAGGSLTLESGAQLTVAAQNFDNAGKGGTVSLESGSELNGVIDNAAILDLKTGALVDLSVASQTSASAALGKFSGTLHLRAPQNAGSDDLQMNALNATILNASSIVVEGYKLFDLTSSGGAITTATQDAVKTNGTVFGGNAGAISNRLLVDNTALASVLHVQPGAEIINRTGDLILTTTWDLSRFRFGAGVDAAILGSGEPGNLTLRAAGNLVFNFQSSLSDGFVGTTYTSAMQLAGVHSWAYSLIAGSDFSSANKLQVMPLASLASNSGSVLLGQGSLPLPTTAVDKRSSIIPDFYQVIRTGTGDIEISAGRDVQLLNPLATIYTAGTQAVDISDFDRPSNPPSSGAYGNIGSNQGPYFRAQYSLAGGNINITASNDIIRLVGGSPDSTREMPTNWLYRRSYVDPATGVFGQTTTSSSAEIASTSWWIDYSNFFQGVGALGGGNVMLNAGRDVANVDAVVPTNARMTKGVPNAANLQELGGGDLFVTAGRNIDGGVYYVERGYGSLDAGGNIKTNSTRAAQSLKTISNSSATPDSSTWLPTTLFIGKSTFDVSAKGDLLLGPVVNPFWLPQGINNGLVQKTYFTTYAADSGVQVHSLNGDIILKSNAVGGEGSLSAWYSAVTQFYQNPGSYSDSQPWLRTIETAPSAFTTATTLLPSTFTTVAFSGDINIIGSMTLSPSATGTISLIAQGSVNGLQINGITQTGLHAWSTSSINLSDADPTTLPSIITPINLSGKTTINTGSGWLFTPEDIFANLNSLFNESGSVTGNYAVIQTQQSLHGQLNGTTLHKNDSEPVRIIASQGDISGLTIYSGKFTDVFAGRDISDISLYVQNNSPADITRMVAGRDILLYNALTPLRLLAQSDGNRLNLTNPVTPGPLSGNPTAGDVQIAGPGILQLFSSRDLILGAVANNTDGTASGVTSVGKARNPYLSSEAASITIAAGIGGSQKPDYQAFEAKFLNPATAGAYATRYLPDLGALLGLSSSATNDQIWTTFTQLPSEKQDGLSRSLFYAVLRDAGRDHNDVASAGFGNYAAGYAAIDALFPGSKDWAGNLSLSSREISTTNGGDISVFAPGGGLSLGTDQPKNSGTPPGIITERGGSISIFARDNVDIGVQRIFTLRGGDVLIWSSTGNIAAGFSSKTVQSAAPTRVLIDPQSGDVKTDLAGLATGGGIGVLATVQGVEPGNVDLIAPVGSIDAGDAGIRSSGNLNIAALQVLNAGNIQTGGTSTGTPAASAAPVSAPPSTAASESANSASDLAQSSRDQGRNGGNGDNVMPSLISVEVLGYGGSDPSAPDSDEKKDDKKDEAKAEEGASPGQLTKQDSSLDGQHTALKPLDIHQG